MAYTIDEVKIGQKFHYGEIDKNSRYDAVLEVINLVQKDITYFTDDKGLVVEFRVISTKDTEFEVGKIYTQGAFTSHWNSGLYQLLEELSPEIITTNFNRLKFIL